MKKQMKIDFDHNIKYLVSDYFRLDQTSILIET